MPFCPARFSILRFVEVVHGERLPPGSGCRPSPWRRARQPLCPGPSDDDRSLMPRYYDPHDSMRVKPRAAPRAAPLLTRPMYLMRLVSGRRKPPLRPKNGLDPYKWWSTACEARSRVLHPSIATAAGTGTLCPPSPACAFCWLPGHLSGEAGGSCCAMNRRGALGRAVWRCFIAHVVHLDIRHALLIVWGSLSYGRCSLANSSRAIGRRIVLVRWLLDRAVAVRFTMCLCLTSFLLGALHFLMAACSIALLLRGDREAGSWRAARGQTRLRSTAWPLPFSGAIRGVSAHLYGVIGARGGAFLNLTGALSIFFFFFFFCFFFFFFFIFVAPGFLTRMGMFLCVRVFRSVRRMRWAGSRASPPRSLRAHHLRGGFCGLDLICGNSQRKARGGSRCHRARPAVDARRGWPTCARCGRRCAVHACRRLRSQLGRKFTALRVCGGCPLSPLWICSPSRGYRQINSKAVRPGAARCAPFLRSGMMRRSKSACREAAQGRCVEAPISNFPPPAQLVHSGEKAAVQRANSKRPGTRAQARGALPVSVPRTPASCAALGLSPHGAALFSRCA